MSVKDIHTHGLYTATLTLLYEYMHIDMHESTGLILGHATRFQVSNIYYKINLKSIA